MFTLPRSRTLRRVASVFGALTLAVSLTACGSEDDPQPTTAGPAAGTFPITVEHQFGTTTIKKKPLKIVTIGLSDHEPVLALGHKPIGAIDWFERKPFTDWPWVKDAWGGGAPEVLGVREAGLKQEKLAALQPDLIFAMYSGIEKKHYDQLSQLAPVVAQPKGYDPYAAPWKVYTQLAGKALGEEAKANKLIADIDKKFADVRAANPQWKGKTAVAADSFKPGVYSAFQKGDPKSAFLADLGFTIPEEITKKAGKANVVEFGSEGLNQLEVDRLVWLTTGKEPHARIKNDPVYKELKVAKEGRDLFLTYQDPPIGAALSYYTVLSIPYAIDQVVPLLKK